MAYKQRNEGGFRARVSFPVHSALVADLNAICEGTGHTMAHICETACRLLAQRYVIEGHFTREPQPWPAGFEATIESDLPAANAGTQQVLREVQPGAGA
jgi:hypothetical protein